MVAITTRKTKTNNTKDYRHTKKNSNYFGRLVLIIANFCRMIFKRIVPDEYYLFSSGEYSLAAC